MNFLHDFFEAIVGFAYAESNGIAKRRSTKYGLEDLALCSTLGAWFVDR
jgi:hypothetical protein